MKCLFLIISLYKTIAWTLTVLFCFSPPLWSEWMLIICFRRHRGATSCRILDHFYTARLWTLPSACCSEATEQKLKSRRPRPLAPALDQRSVTGGLDCHTVRWKHHMSEAATLRPQRVGWLRAPRPVNLQDVRVPLYSRANGQRQNQAKNHSVSLLWRYTCVEIPSCLLFIRANSPIRRWSKTAPLHRISSVVDNAPLRPIITLFLPGIQLRPQPDE